MQFRFKDKETALLLVSSVVHSMQLYPMEEVLTAPYLISDWRPDLIQNLVDDLVPEKCRIVVVGQKVEPICTETEYWYGTKYHNESIAESVIEVSKKSLMRAKKYHKQLSGFIINYIPTGSPCNREICTLLC